MPTNKTHLEQEGGAYIANDTPVNIPIKIFPYIYQLKLHRLLFQLGLIFLPKICSNSQEKRLAELNKERFELIMQ